MLLLMILTFDNDVRFEKIKKVVQRNRQLRDEIDSIISSLGDDSYVHA